MNGLTPGRIVHYVFVNDYKDVVHRAALITAVPNGVDGVVNLIVFPDGTNDIKNIEFADAWKVGVHYSDQKEVDTWHWIEPA